MIVLDKDISSLNCNQLVLCQCYVCGNGYGVIKKKVVQTLKSDNGRNKYCSPACLKVGKTKSIKTVCKNCGIEIAKHKRDFVKNTYSFCSRSCSASYINSILPKRIKKAIPIKEPRVKLVKIKQPKKSRKLPPKILNCFRCGTQFERQTIIKYCSTSCRIAHAHETGLYVRSGIASAKSQSISRRSKNEILFYNMCADYFDSVEANINMFNGWDADVIIHDVKTAVLWNGKWHYEKICNGHSVLQVQNRDKIKIEEIKKSGYTPYIVKDMGSFNPVFVSEQFEIFKKNI